MEKFKVGDNTYEVKITHDPDGTAEVAIQGNGFPTAAFLIDARGVSSVVMEQCLVVLRRKA